MRVSKERLQKLEEVTADAEQRKEWAWQHAAEAYTERDLLVCALARVFPSHRMVHTQGAKSRNPRLVVCIHTPVGQLNFMLNEEMQDRLGDLELLDNHWDGHKRPEKRDRMRRLGERPSEPPSLQ